MTVSITSDTEIVNQALALLGEESVFTIDEETKRARLAKALYSQSLNIVLAYNWPFARRIKKLNEIGELDNEDKIFSYVHRTPSDSHHIIDLLPIGRGGKWEQIGVQIHSNFAEPRALYITKEISPANFSGPFVNSVVLYLAHLLAGPITRDPKRTQELFQVFSAGLFENLRLDAGIGSEHLHPDANADNDAFVTGEPHVESEALDDLSKRYLLPDD